MSTDHRRIDRDPSHLAALHRLALHSVCETLVGLEGVGELVGIGPDAAIDQLVDVRTIGTLGI